MGNNKIDDCLLECCPSTSVGKQVATLRGFLRLGSLKTHPHRKKNRLAQHQTVLSFQAAFGTSQKFQPAQSSPTIPPPLVHSIFPSNRRWRFQNAHCGLLPIVHCACSHTMRSPFRQPENKSCRNGSNQFCSHASSWAWYAHRSPVCWLGRKSSAKIWVWAMGMARWAQVCCHAA